MKQVVIVIPECRVNLNTVCGAYDILSKANEYWEGCGNGSALDIRIAGFISELQSHNHNLTIQPIDIRKIKKTDLILIPSPLGDFEDTIKKNKPLIDWIRCQYKEGSEIASMCSGGFLLAATGLLNGKTCSIHWNKVRTFKQLFPEVTVAPDTIIIAGNGIYSNGGAYSFLNLILYLVEHYFDRETAIYCSKVFQIDMERSSQSSFHIFEVQKDHGDELIAKAQNFIEENFSGKISFAELASDLASSRRNFDRRFIKATGNTPVEYLQRVKVEAAKNALEKGRKTINEVMYEVGYSDDKAFREVFRKITGITPLEYKNKYNKEGSLV